jgi:hypothetical protein
VSPYHNRSLSSFQQHLTLLNLPPPLVLQGIIAFAADHRNAARWSKHHPKARLHHLGESHRPHLARWIGHTMLVLISLTAHRLGRWCADDERATAPPCTRAPCGAHATPAGMGRPSQIRHWAEPARGASGQMEACYYSSHFNLQKTYLGLNFKNS